MILDESFEVVDADLVARLQQAEVDKSYDTVTHALMMLNRALHAKSLLISTLQDELAVQVQKNMTLRRREQGG